MTDRKDRQAEMTDRLKDIKKDTPMSREVVVQNYDISDIWLSVFLYAITLDSNSLLLC